jgi:hypothetical protein
MDYRLRGVMRVREVVMVRGEAVWEVYLVELEYYTYDAPFTNGL